MNIGEPQREIIVEPIELPEPLREQPEPDHQPERHPEEEPARV